MLLRISHHVQCLEHPLHHVTSHFTSCGVPSAPPAACYFASCIMRSALSDPCSMCVRISHHVECHEHVGDTISLHISHHRSTFPFLMVCTMWRALEHAQHHTSSHMASSNPWPRGRPSCEGVATLALYTNQPGTLISVRKLYVMKQGVRRKAPYGIG